MGVTDAPQWLSSAFVRSARSAGATAPREALEACALRLIGRWQEPERSFHNLRHVIDVLARVDELAEETHHPDVVRLAAWYHGAVFNSAAAVAYARRGGEDEEASAALARTELTGLGVPEKVADRVATLIRNLKRHDADRGDGDCLALSDADLGTLAVEPQRYAAYRAAVRAEYAHLPLRDYLEARVAIITKLLARRRLYGSPLGAVWEEPARENLSAELQRLEAELRRMDRADAGAGEGREVDPERSSAVETPAPPPVQPVQPVQPDDATARATGTGAGVADDVVGAPGGGARPGSAHGESARVHGAHDAATAGDDATGGVPQNYAAPDGAPQVDAAGDAPRDDDETRVDAAYNDASPDADDDARAGTNGAADDDEYEDEDTDEGPLDEDAPRPVHGIEREPEPIRSPRRGSERRGWRGRRGDKGAASRTPIPDDIDSTGSLFRPPPTLPRP